MNKSMIMPTIMTIRFSFHSHILFTIFYLYLRVIHSIVILFIRREFIIWWILDLHWQSLLESVFGEFLYWQILFVEFYFCCFLFLSWLFDNKVKFGLQINTLPTITQQKSKELHLSWNSLSIRELSYISIFTSLKSYLNFLTKIFTSSKKIRFPW